MVDAHVVITAAAASATVWTSDPDDLARLADHVPDQVRIRRV